MRLFGRRTSNLPAIFARAGQWEFRCEAVLLLDAGTLPTAITAINDHGALGVIDRLHRSGFEVPEQISVAAYDNSPISQLAAVNLTSVSQEAAVQAEWAVHAAVERLDGEPRPARESVLAPRLVVRGSTGPPARAASCDRGIGGARMAP